jgi:uncharacterized protein YgbK (DUF1537 family)
MSDASLDIDVLLKYQVPDDQAFSILTEIKMLCVELRIKIVVLDDDPTGTQTVHDIPVITNWSKELIMDTLITAAQGFFILTNTRSMPEKEAVTINTEIAQQVKLAAAKTGCSAMLISRGDSTLRGHFPAELLALEKGWGRNSDGYVLMPYFKEGGRYTINNIHYVRDGNQLIPASSTPFASDKVFGYSSGNLAHYIYEKTNGLIHIDDIKTVSLEQLNRGVSAIGEELGEMQIGQYAIVNGTCLYHAAVFALFLLRQWQKGKQYLVRCAASLVQALFGIGTANLLSPSDLIKKNSSAGGLIVVGSYIDQSTRQLQHLQRNTHITSLEIDVTELLWDEPAVYIRTIADSLNNYLQQAISVVLYTSRNIVTSSGTQANLDIGSRISSSLVCIVKQLTGAPKFLVAKGGITSSDIATKALQIQRANIAGQLIHGVPVWESGPEAKFPGMPFIIFPGNVGTDDSLTNVYTLLSKK